MSDVTVVSVVLAELAYCIAWSRYDSLSLIRDTAKTYRLLFLFSVHNLHSVCEIQPNLHAKPDPVLHMMEQIFYNRTKNAYKVSTTQSNSVQLIIIYENRHRFYIINVLLYWERILAGCKGLFALYERLLQVKNHFPSIITCTFDCQANYYDV